MSDLEKFKSKFSTGEYAYDYDSGNPVMPSHTCYRKGDRVHIWESYGKHTYEGITVDLSGHVGTIVQDGNYVGSAVSVRLDFEPVQTPSAVWGFGYDAKGWRIRCSDLRFVVSVRTSLPDWDGAARIAESGVEDWLEARAAIRLLAKAVIDLKDAKNAV
jgi:hypothetical protein